MIFLFPGNGIIFPKRKNICAFPDLYCIWYIISEISHIFPLRRIVQQYASILFHTKLVLLLQVMTKEIIHYSFSIIF